ncbi:MAG: response regulator, partial [Bacteroidales bacterium]|nr:response regulator [Bacteroidales bacterium]
MAQVLVIDDERAIRNTLKDVLEYEEYKVDIAEDGLVGLEKIKNGKYDVILLDIKMPGMDGIEVLDSIFEMGTDVPVIMISGHASLDTA